MYQDYDQISGLLFWLHRYTYIFLLNQSQEGNSKYLLNDLDFYILSLIRAFSVNLRISDLICIPYPKQNLLQNQKERGIIPLYLNL